MVETWHLPREIVGGICSVKSTFGERILYVRYCVKHEASSVSRRRGAWEVLS